MPRHQTSRNLISSDPDEKEKLEVFRKYAQISLELQEYGSAILGGVEALLVIIATTFLYSTVMEHFPNYSSYFFITGQTISLIVNCMDCYELLTHTLNGQKTIDFPTISHFITTGSYIVGTLLIILGNVLALSYIQAFDAASWVFLSVFDMWHLPIGSLLFSVGAMFGASDSLIEADQFVIFFRSLFGKCNIVGTFAFLFGSVVGVVKIWSPPLVSLWLSNLLAATFQVAGVFFLVAAALSIAIIARKNKKKEHINNEKAALFRIH